MLSDEEDGNRASTENKKKDQDELTEEEQSKTFEELVCSDNPLNCFERLE